MDYWDPALVNRIASTRPVILFDNAGVGKSTGTVANTMKGMAQHAIAFLDALNIKEVDVLGFSMGGLVTPLVYLNGPKGLVKHLVIAGSGTSTGDELTPQTPDRAKRVQELCAGPHIPFDHGFDQLFFYPNEHSQAAGRAWWKRIHERDVSTSGEERSKLVSDGFVDGGAGMKNMLAAFAAFADPAQRADGSYDRLGSIDIPVFIGQGQDDLMIPTSHSYVMQTKIPDSRLKIYPQAGHGFHYQHAEEFADDVNAFLDGKYAKLVHQKL